MRRKETPNWIIRPLFCGTLTISTVLFNAFFQGHIPRRTQSHSGKSLLLTFDFPMPAICYYSWLYIYISNSLFSSVRSCSMLDCLIIFRWSTASWTKLLCFWFKRTDFNSRCFPRRWKRSHHFILRAHGSHRIYWLWQVRCTCSKALSSVVTSYNMRPRDIPTKCCVLLLLAFFSP